MRHLFPICLLALFALSCKKNNKALNDPTIELNVIDDKFIEANETVWFEAELTAGTIYKLAWYDGWFDNYTGSVWMTGYHQNQSTTYFDWTRLIQMTGSPKTFMPYQTETFYLKCENYSDTNPAEIGIELVEIDKNTSNHIDLNHLENINIPIGETQLYDFDVLADSVYTITIQGSDNIGAYGDEAHVIVSAFSDFTETTFFLEEVPGNSWSGPNTFQITPVYSEKIYVTVTAAYWFLGRSLSILVED